jgi:hypothetical protein
MIQSSELRIGNLIEFPKKGYKGNTVADIFNISTDKLNYFAGPLDCNPIPLTEEWMLGFGFDKEEKDFGPPIWDGYTEFSLNGYCFMQDRDAAWFLTGYNWNTEHFKYVHQLQNLYHALTGTELKEVKPIDKKP